MSSSTTSRYAARRVGTRQTTPPGGPWVAALVFSLTLLVGCSTPSEREATATATPPPQPQVTKAHKPKPVTAQDQAVPDLKVLEEVASVRASAELAARTTAGLDSQYAPNFPAAHLPRAPAEPLDRENYQSFDDNPVKLAREEPVSTFSIDVDTAAYSNVRRFLGQGQLPRQGVVRVEELINYFSYAYDVPGKGDAPFAVHTELGPSPWHPQRKLLHVGIQGYEVPSAELPPANLVFLVDVSGSMQSPDKLGLLKASLKLLTAQLDARDRIAIAVYAGAAGTVLPPTSGAERARITSAIDALTAGGSTNGGAGIRLAYALAEQHHEPGAISRVILATDGDFNVGTVDQQALRDLIEEKRRSGVALSVLGFGSGNYNDALMQELAQTGNGNAAYIDTLNEARKVLVDELSSTLNIIASDVKIQIEFNPALVSEYRLIGYETRALAREDFNNDRVDAGDIGAGHSVTALYELALVGDGGDLVDPLRYGDRSDAAPRKGADPREGAEQRELAFLKLRFKTPGEATSQLITKPVLAADLEDELTATSASFRFAAAVAAFGQRLRGGEHLGAFDFADIEQLAAGARGEDRSGYRGEFLGLTRTAAALAGTPAADQQPLARAP